MADMRMADLKPQFSYLISQIAQRHTDFAYLHVVEPRVSGFINREPQPGEVRRSLATCSLRSLLTSFGSR